MTDFLQSTSILDFYCQFICERRSRPPTIYIQKMRHKYIVKNIFNEFSTFYLYVSTLQKFCLLLQFLAVHKILKGTCTVKKTFPKSGQIYLFWFFSSWINNTRYWRWNFLRMRRTIRYLLKLNVRWYLMVCLLHWKLGWSVVFQCRICVRINFGIFWFDTILKSNLFWNRHWIRSSLDFPPNFEFLNSDSAWKRLVKCLHLKSWRFSNP